MLYITNLNVLAEDAASLARDYGLEVTDEREKNVNAFMRLCGVSYQLVRVRLC